jgi:hypothetical protein
MKKLGLELPMRAKGVYPPHPAIQGVRRLGGKKVFRAGVFCIVAAFRLWRLQPWGLRTYLERSIENTFYREHILTCSPDLPGKVTYVSSSAYICILLIYMYPPPHYSYLDSKKEETLEAEEMLSHSIMYMYPPHIYVSSSSQQKRGDTGGGGKAVAQHHDCGGAAHARTRQRYPPPPPHMHVPSSACILLLMWKSG